MKGVRKNKKKEKQGDYDSKVYWTENSKGQEKKTDSDDNFDRELEKSTQ